MHNLFRTSIAIGIKEPRTSLFTSSAKWIYFMWTSILFITTVAEQVDNIPSKAGLAQPPVVSE